MDCEWCWVGLLSWALMGSSSSQLCTYFFCLLSEGQKLNQAGNMVYNWQQDFKVRNLNLGSWIHIGVFRGDPGCQLFLAKPVYCQSSGRSAADRMWPRTVCTQSFICFQSALRKTAFSQFRCDLRSKWCELQKRYNQVAGPCSKPVTGTAEDTGTEEVSLTAFKMCYMMVLVTLPLPQAML